MFWFTHFKHSHKPNKELIVANEKESFVPRSVLINIVKTSRRHPDSTQICQAAAESLVEQLHQLILVASGDHPAANTEKKIRGTMTNLVKDAQYIIYLYTCLTAP